MDEVDEKLLDKPHKEHFQQSSSLKTSEKNGSPAPDFRKRKLKSIDDATSEQSDFQSDDLTNLVAGVEIEHPRFGKGKVIAVEGIGPNKKAKVYFNVIGEKNLLLRFAKLKILS